MGLANRGKEPLETILTWLFAVGCVTFLGILIAFVWAN